MKTSRRKWLWPVAVLLVPVFIFTLFLWSEGASLQAWRILGPANLDILLHADRLETYRIDPNSGAGETFEGRKIIGKSTKNDAAFCARVKATVLKVFNTKPVLSTSGPDCDTLPGVGFRFYKGPQTLDALVCYECSDIAFISKSGNGSSGGFWSQYAAMRKLAKEAFPHDAEIQKFRIVD